MNTPHPVNIRIADAFVKVTDQLMVESDRGTVVLAFAWMDEELTRTLKQYFLPSRSESEKADELFGVGRPIGDASTKIDVASRLNLINDTTRESLHLVRRLRNDFAHLSTELTFETPSVRDRVGHLFSLQDTIISAFWKSTREIPELSETLRAHDRKNPVAALLDQFGAKRLFGIISGIIVAGLVMVTSEVVPVKDLENRQQSEA